jgi:glucose 1-dehydrogenase
MGHEAAGGVEKVGSGVKSVRPGDIVVITVRRGCGECSPCLHNVSEWKPGYKCRRFSPR